MAMQLERGLLRAVMWSTVADGTLTQFSLPLDPALSGHKALEEAVYAAPVLLADFASVQIVVRASHFMIVPEGLDADLCLQGADYALLSADKGEVDTRTDALPGTGAKIVWQQDSGTASFLARTFRNPSVMCHISPLIRFFSRRANIGNRGKLYAHFHECAGLRRLDIVAFGHDGKPALAATHPLNSEDDAVYYIVASMRRAGLDPAEDEALLCGHAPTREAIMPRLRRYVPEAMPVIFPSAALRAGHEALNAPFPIILLPLCE